MAIQPGGYIDRPQDDNTKHAHPAFQRGAAKGTLDVLDILRGVITGEDDGSGTCNAAEIEKIRRAVYIMRQALLNKSIDFSKSGKSGKVGFPGSDESEKLAAILSENNSSLNEAENLANSLIYRKK